MMGPFNLSLVFVETIKPCSSHPRLLRVISGSSDEGIARFAPMGPDAIYVTPASARFDSTGVSWFQSKRAMMGTLFLSLFPPSLFGCSRILFVTWRSYMSSCAQSFMDWTVERVVSERI